MAETIFAKILRGEIPCHRVYEDAHVLAFLDIFPLSRGHTLVIPKEPAATLDQLSDDAAAAIARVLPRIARAVMRVSGATAFNVLQNNGALAHQAVFHVHFHVIPRFDGDGAAPAGSAGARQARRRRRRAGPGDRGGDRVRALAERQRGDLALRGPASQPWPRRWRSRRSRCRPTWARRSTGSST
jgi:histidine triad (HIT) family protein